MNGGIRGAIGFSMKAGKCSSGEFAADKAFTARRARLVLLDARASEGTRERWRRRCDAQGVPWLEVDCLGEAIGKENRMVAAIVDEGFAAMIMRSANTEPIDDGGRLNE